MCSNYCTPDHDKLRWAIWVGVVGVLVYFGLTVLSGCSPAARGVGQACQACRAECDRVQMVVHSCGDKGCQCQGYP